MVIHFVYTECQSPGPFKSEPGFKVKSAVVPEYLADDFPGKLFESKAVLEQATGYLGSYTPPEVSPLVSREEFDGLSKSWLYAQLPGLPSSSLELDNRPSNSFLFSRMFTSGYAGGRPRNPFHEGYIFRASDGRRIVEYCKGFTHPLAPRPIDLVDSIGWESPKGDLELEAVELTTTDVFELSTFENRLNNSLRELVLSDLETTKWIVARFSDALLDSRHFGIAAESIDEFYDWVSLFTHLIHAPMTWRVDFSDTWTKPRPSENHWLIYRGNMEQSVPSDDSQALADMIVSSFELGAELELLTIFDWLGENALAQTRNLAGGLPLLVLAYLMLDEQFFPEDNHSDNQSALGLFNQLSIHLKWRDESSRFKVVQRIEESTSIRLNDANMAELLAALMRGGL